MAEKIDWNFVVQALHGPSVSGADTLDLEAYDKIEVTIADNATPSVDLGATTSKMSLLIINPEKPSEKLTYTNNGKDVPLDGPHLFIGAGAISLLDDVNQLKFTNHTGSDAVVKILIGRNTTA